MAPLHAEHRRYMRVPARRGAGTAAGARRRWASARADASSLRGRRLGLARRAAHLRDEPLEQPTARTALSGLRTRCELARTSDSRGRCNLARTRCGDCEDELQARRGRAALARRPAPMSEELSCNLQGRTSSARTSCGAEQGGGASCARTRGNLARRRLPQAPSYAPSATPVPAGLGEAARRARRTCPAEAVARWRGPGGTREDARSRAARRRRARSVAEGEAAVRPTTAGCYGDDRDRGDGEVVRAEAIRPKLIDLVLRAAEFDRPNSVRSRSPGSARSTRRCGDELAGGATPPRGEVVRGDRTRQSEQRAAADLKRPRPVQVRIVQGRAES